MTGLLSAKRITVEAPVSYVNSLDTFHSLAAIAYPLNQPSDLHLTLLHIGRLPELIGEVEEHTNSFDQRERIERSLVGWLASLRQCEGFVGSTSVVGLYGPHDGRVAALDIHVDRSLLEVRRALVNSLFQVLLSLGIADPHRFINGSKALGYTTGPWRPHVSLGPPKLGEASYPVNCPRMELGFGVSKIRNLEHVLASQGLA